MLYVVIHHVCVGWSRHRACVYAVTIPENTTSSRTNLDFGNVHVAVPVGSIWYRELHTRTACILFTPFVDSQHLAVSPGVSAASVLGLLRILV